MCFGWPHQKAGKQESRKAGTGEHAYNRKAGNGEINRG
jgi:hypothetical protein